MDAGKQREIIRLWHRLRRLEREGRPTAVVAKNDPRLANAVEARKRSLADAAAARAGGKRPVDITRAIPHARCRVDEFAS